MKKSIFQMKKHSVIDDAIRIFNENKGDERFDISSCLTFAIRDCGFQDLTDIQYKELLTKAKEGI